MKILRIILALLLLILVVVGLGGFALFNEVTRGPLPQLSGEITLAGQTVTAQAGALTIPALSAPVTIIRDSWGVPHIYAENLNDLYYAQGYTQAQDRWWQMAFYRAIGSGRIQELTGGNDEALGSDIFIRTIGWRRASERDLAEVYDDDTLAALQAFADGVNAYIFSRPQDDLALAYTLLGLTGVQIEIEPWTPADTVTFTKIMAWNLSGGLEDLTRAELIAQLGEAMVADYEPQWPYGRRPTIILADDLATDAADAATTQPEPIARAAATASARLAGGVRPDAGFGMVMGSDIGSNNWVVSGDMTASGKPILANDPHLGIQMPSIWYEIGLHCQPVSDACPLNARGFTFALSPTIITGHNARIAWGVTNVGPDVIDLFRVEINPENPLQYRWDGAWRDMTVHEEIIRAGDSDATVTIQVRETHLGPIINDNDLNDAGQPTGFNNDDPMALRWTALDPDTTVTAFLRLGIASNWDDFRVALGYFGAPSQNFVYADVDGNIGYQVPGRIPVRPAINDGLLPINAVDDSPTWLGYLPYDELPRLFNPERGYIASANQAVVPQEYYDGLAERLADEFGPDANYSISTAWDYGYRGARIDALLTAETTHSIETTRRIQTDNFHIGASELMPYLVALDIADPALAEARDWLAAWDFVAHQDSAQAVYYATFWKHLMRALFDDQLGEANATTGGGQQWWATALLLDDPENIWWDDAATPDVTETRDAILIRALDEGYAAAREALGEDRTAWRWGALHGATFVSQPLGVSGIDLVEGLVNRGPYPTSGGVSIVNATRWDTNADDFGVMALPSYRMIVDLSDLEAGLSIHSTGQSGHPYSPHYDDMIAPWAALDYKPMLFTRAQVEAAAANTLILRP
jgi:penicillin amidase